MSAKSESMRVLGFAAHSGSGKTTLLERLIPLLRQAGLALAVIKHSHHDFEIDRPGKDSERLRRAGAGQVLLASPWRTAWIREGDGRSEPRLDELLRRLDHSTVDLVLVEGFRHESIPKIEVHRPSLGSPLLCRSDRHILAVACDEPPREKPNLPLLDLNRPQEVARWILEWLGQR
jgi:molybdopterin-guanine dinucleotide biosynthesis protein B